jgi:hypothetical protein
LKTESSGSSWATLFGFEQDCKKPMATITRATLMSLFMYYYLFFNGHMPACRSGISARRHGAARIIIPLGVAVFASEACDLRYPNPVH